MYLNVLLWPSYPSVPRQNTFNHSLTTKFFERETPQIILQSRTRLFTMSTEDAWYMADKLREVLEAKNFNKDDFDTRAFKLSQAFCLLWQDKDTGEVSGRQRSGKTANAAVVAVLIDLFILGKIEFEALVKQWTSMRRKREIIYVKVIEHIFLIIRMITYIGPG